MSEDEMILDLIADKILELSLAIENGCPMLILEALFVQNIISKEYYLKISKREGF